MNMPTQEGFFWYKGPRCDRTVVETERRPDSAELYAFCIGFTGGIPVRLMGGDWLGEARPPESKED